MLDAFESALHGLGVAAQLPRDRRLGVALRREFADSGRVEADDATGVLAGLLGGLDALALADAGALKAARRP